MSRTGRNLSAFAVAALSLCAVPTLAGAADPSVVKVKPYGLSEGRAKILSRVIVAGSLSPWREGQRVRVFFYRNAKPLFSKSVAVQKGDGNWGTFRAKVTMRRGGKHAVQVRYYGRGGDQPLAPDSTVRKRWRVWFPELSKGQCGPVVEGFRKALNRMAFVPGRSRCFNGKVERAVLAYRKLNGLGRSAHAGPRIVKRVFNLKGRYRVRRPDLGNHVEAPLSRQVIVFSRGKKPYAIFPIASGAPATPTILGVYSFYRKDPGYNAIGMYYSSYFIRGYAIHGYKSVPNYPASHGCLRTFIADQPRIYELTEIGMPIYTFGNAFVPFRLAPDLPDPAEFDLPQ
jgi:hypothetical protein